MRQLVRRGIKPGTALSIAALVLAASGGAYAATTGGRTITVCVKAQGGGLYSARHCLRHDRKLSWNVKGPRGATGLPGAAGMPGSPGVAGLPGVKGDPGPVTGVLPSGVSEKGVFVARNNVGVASTIETAISFPLTLSTDVPAFYVPSAGPAVPQCPGSAAKPSAAPGNLCVYESVAKNAVFVTSPFLDSGSSSTTTAQPFGIIIRAYANAAGDTYIYGSWAVTAP